MGNHGSTPRPVRVGTAGIEAFLSGPATPGVVVTTPSVWRLALAAHLARFRNQSRVHTESELRGYFDWCRTQAPRPIGGHQAHLELYVRWLQEIRRYRLFTASLRTSVVAGFYRTYVIAHCSINHQLSSCDGPNLPAQIPYFLGLTHLQLEAMLAAARERPIGAELEDLRQQ